MKKFLSLILSVCFSTAVFAQGVHLYKNGARITVNSNEVDSLVYFPGQEEGQSLFQYIDQAVKNAVEANQTVWEIGYDGYWYKNGVQTEFLAVGRDGMNGCDGHTPDLSFWMDDNGHLIVTIDGVTTDLGRVTGDNQYTDDPDPIDPESLASFNYDFKSMHVGDTFVQVVSTISDGTVKYTSSNPSVATVDVNSGLVTALSLGETLITATVEATAKYPAGTASYKVVVEEGNFVNGYEYVDLGVKNAQGQTIYWAKCNVGATKPYEYGDYYAWGETETKTVYSWETYKYAEFVTGTPAEYDADGFLIKPATDDHYEGQNIGEDISGTQYDAARQNWGGSWRMPTEDEFSRLKTQCDWTWTEMKNSDGNPIKGYKVSNKSDNSKYIFLPAAGSRYDSYLGYAGSGGSCWSSSLSISYSISACRLYFDSSSQGTNYDYRCYGLSVRAVCVSIE